MAVSGNNLNGKQCKAIAALLSERDIKAAARKAQVGERTLHRWMNEDAHFKAALYAAEGAAIDAATRRLIAGQNKALDTLEAIHSNEDVPPNVRRAAAENWLANSMKIRELRNVEARLEALEQALGGQR